MKARDIPWTRFWLPRTGVVDLSDGGFLLDPTQSYFRTRTPSPAPLEDLAKFRALGLIGEPGIGKSTALKADFTRLGAAIENDATTSVHFDLRNFSSEAFLYTKIFESPEISAWKRGASQLILHLDSLDEALLRIDTIANLLASELRTLPIDRLSIRIACRTASWPGQTLEPALKETWGDDAVGVFELVPLRRVDVTAAAEARELDPGAFIEQLYAANVVPFAIKPLTLNLLLELFRSDGRLPRDITDIYVSGCRKLCEEQNPSRRDARRIGQLNPDQRLRLAARIGAVTIFANRYAIWTGAETDPIPETDVPLSKLSTGSEEGDFQIFPCHEANIREALDTGLFSARDVGRMGWAHQSYAEFLAAHYLIGKGTPPRNMLKLLTHPSGGLVPQLSTVAAWVASLNAEIRSELISMDPLALLRGDVSNWSGEDLSELTEALLAAYDRQLIHDVIPGVVTAYARLHHPGLSAQLKAYITDKSKDIHARRTACLIAQACQLAASQPALLSVALDVSENPSLRARAVSALGACGDDSIPDQLMPLAKDELGPDPTNDIKGSALEILWPKHISATELFSILDQPNEGYFGAYAMFLTDRLPNTLQTEDLLSALQWATALIKTFGPLTNDYQRKSLADAILILCWRQISRPELTRPFVEHVLLRIAGGGDLFKGTDVRRQDVFLAELESEIDKRRAFLLAVCERKLGKIEAIRLMRVQLLRASDYGWLLGISPHGNNRIEGLDEESLCTLIEVIFDWKDGAQFESLYALANKWEPLRLRYKYVLDGVPLDSADAKQAMENHRLMKSLERERRPSVEPPPAERVKDCLSRFEAGQHDAWWHLNCELTLSPQSTHYGGDHDFIITDMPGWRAADEDVRSRIIAAAERYLREAKTLVSEWIGTGSYQRGDYAAYRALILLRSTRPETYRQLGSELWQKWAPVVAAVDRVTGAEEAGLHDDLVADACVAASAEFVEAVRKLIQAERERTPQQPDKMQQLTPFFILRRLEKCWGSSALQDAVFAELQDDANSPTQAQALLERLLAAGHEPARDYAVALLSDVRPERRGFVLSAALSLAQHSTLKHWRDVWRVAHDREDIGEELFLYLAEHGRFGEPFYTVLEASALGDLYLWLERKFPHTGDPNRQSGTPQWVGPRGHVADLRDSVLRHIIELGSNAGVQALRAIIAERPDLTWLPIQLSRAEQTLRTKTWTPLKPSEVLRMASSKRGRLVESPSDLCDVLLDALGKYQGELHGEQTPVRSLWDRQADQSMRPVDENALSDHVRLFLKRELAESGIVLNREVEVARVPGAPVGTRTDIKIDAVRHSETGEVYDVITAVIETKGCWNADLLTSIPTQLRDDYLKRLAAPLGVYLVGWFDKAKWDPGDSRRKRTPNWDLDEARRHLDEKALEAAKGYMIRAVVLDCHAP